MAGTYNTGKRWRWLLPALLTLLLATSCSGLGGEPEIVATISADTMATAQASAMAAQMPASTPNLASGAAIFAARCTQCHGENGNGQGALVLDEQIPEMASFLEPATMREQTPVDYYNVITNGRIENLMPPWRDALSDQERWDVALYTYTLHYGDAAQDGAEVWQQLDITPEDVTGSDSLNISDSAIYGQIAAAADTDLDDAALWQAVAYARSQTVDAGSTSTTAQADSEPEAEATEPAAQETISFRGSVTNGTPDGDVPDDLVIELTYTDMQTLSESLMVDVDGDGGFVFENVPYGPNYRYIAFTVYQERLFVIDIAGGDISGTYDLPIEIYELTTDPSVISITSMDIRIEPLQVNDLGNGLLVSQLLVYRNDSDRLFTTDQQVSDNRFESLAVEVPPGALILTGQSNPRYVVNEDEGLQIDTSPVLPGQGHQVVINYFVPYSDGAIIEQPLRNAYAGEMLLSTTPPSLSASADWLTLTDTVDHDGFSVNVYNGQVDLAADDVLRFEINGSPFNTPATTSSGNVITSDNLVLVLVIVAVVTAIAIGAALIILRRKEMQQASSDGTIDDKRIDAIIEAIADLYHHQRRKLKAKLAAMMQNPSEPSA